MANTNKFVSLEKIAEIIPQQKYFVICGHINPDADCIGSQVMASLLFDDLNIPYTNLLANTESVDKEFLFLSNTNNFVKSCDYKPQVDDYCFLQLDVNDNKRMGEYASSLKKKAKVTITIDHHIIDKPSSAYTFCDKDAAANAVLMWRLCKIMDIECSNKLAEAGYLALMGDTGSFRQQNTNTESLLFAADMVSKGADPNFISNKLFMNKSIESINLQKRLLSNLVFINSNKFLIGFLDYDDFKKACANKHDTEGFIDILRSVGSADVVCLLTKDGRDKPIKVSMRSKNDIDVNAFSQKFDGGGHKAAAGFTIYDMDMPDSVKLVKESLLKYIKP